MTILLFRNMGEHTKQSLWKRENKMYNFVVVVILFFFIFYETKSVLLYFSFQEEHEKRSKERKIKCLILCWVPGLSWFWCIFVNFIGTFISILQCQYYTFMRQQDRRFISFLIYKLFTRLSSTIQDLVQELFRGVSQLEKHLVLIMVPFPYYQTKACTHLCVMYSKCVCLCLFVFECKYLSLFVCTFLCVHVIFPLTLLKNVVLCVYTVLYILHLLI